MTACAVYPADISRYAIRMTGSKTQDFLSVPQKLYVTFYYPVIRITQPVISVRIFGQYDIESGDLDGFRLPASSVSGIISRKDILPIFMTPAFADNFPAGNTAGRHQSGH